eukprot:1792298-Pleurochrysis_carterae.AAC.1
MAGCRRSGLSDSLWACIVHGSGAFDGGCRCGDIRTPGCGFGRDACMLHVAACVTASAGAKTDSVASKRIEAAATEKEK